MGMSHNQAARTLGISRQAVAKRVKNGSLVRLADGSIDPTSAHALARCIDPTRVQAAKDAARLHRPEREAAHFDELNFDEAYPEHASNHAAHHRHRRRLTRRHRLGLATRSASQPVVSWAMFAVVAHAYQILESYMEVLGDKLGAPKAWQSRHLAEALEALNHTSCEWLADENGMVRLAEGRPQWRVRGSERGGNAALAWDHAPARAARKGRGPATPKRR